MIRDWWWALLHRFHPHHRYNVVRTGLPPGYYDPSVRLMWAIFSETERFVDGTRAVIDWDSDQEHAKAWKVLTDAVTWWKDNRHTAEGNELEGRLKEEATMHMQAIIAVRGCMWFP